MDAIDEVKIKAQKEENLQKAAVCTREIPL
jgi:hypothetical protein